MQIFSWIYPVFIAYLPVILLPILLIGAGILYARVKSPAAAAFFFGLLVLSLAPWAIRLVGADYASRGFMSPYTVITAAASIAQALGLLFYAISIPKAGAKTNAMVAPESESR